MKHRLSETIVKLLAAGFGLGYSPLLPGTMGSLLGIGTYFLISKFPFWIKLSILIFSYFFGVYISSKAEKLFGKKDARVIVIDEITGCVFFLLFIPFAGWCIILAFVIYRILDLIKPFPANISQKLRGGWGIMTDDMIAGFYTILLTNLVLLIKSKLLC